MRSRVLTASLCTMNHLFVVVVVGDGGSHVIADFWDSHYTRKNKNKHQKAKFTFSLFVGADFSNLSCCCQVRVLAL